VLAANDMSANGVPDHNVGYILDRLLESDTQKAALKYITEDKRSMRVIYTVESDGTQGDISADVEGLAANYRLETTPMGDIVVFHEISMLIFESALVSLAIALVLTALFLMLLYHLNQCPDEEVDKQPQIVQQYCESKVK